MITIIGGTGTLGQALAKRLRTEDNIKIVSRDELKQFEMKKQFPHFEYEIADVTDEVSMKEALRGSRFVFHCAALKQVDVCEANVYQAIRTNLQGTINVARACEANCVEACIFSTTDKAVDPINAYGFTKALAEKYLIDLNRKKSVTEFRIYRWGNVIASRGSFIPSVIEKLKKNEEIPLTDPEMTRFWITIEDAAKFVQQTYKSQNILCDEIRIPPLKSMSVVKLCEIIAEQLNTKPRFVEVGIRPGEKIHEILVTQHRGGLDSSQSTNYDPKEISRMISYL